MKKMFICDIVEFIISIVGMIFFTILSALVITGFKYIFLLLAIYYSYNFVKMWDNIELKRKEREIKQHRMSYRKIKSLKKSL